MIRLCAVILFFGYVVTSQPPPVAVFNRATSSSKHQRQYCRNLQIGDGDKRRVLKIETDFVEKLDNTDRKVKVRALEVEKKDASKEISAVKVSLRNGEGIVSVRGVRGGLLGLS